MVLQPRERPRRCGHARSGGRSAACRLRLGLDIAPETERTGGHTHAYAEEHSGRSEPDEQPESDFWRSVYYHSHCASLMEMIGAYLTLDGQIPGYTVPISHLPIIILAVFLSQAIHEFGHALAAAL